MRIGLFTDTYLPDVNGVVSSIETLRQALVDLGNEVYVICTKPSLQKAELDGYILRLPGVELKAIYGYALTAPMHHKAQKIVEDMKLDVIHAHTEFGAGVFARIVSHNLNIPLVATYHTFYEDYTHYINIFKWDKMEPGLKKATIKFSKLFGNACQQLIVPTEKTKERLLDYGVTTKMTIIPTGLNLDLFNTDESIENPFVDNPFTVIYVGRLAAEKSVDVIIDAIVQLRKQGEKVSLLVVGDGPSREDIEQLIEKNQAAEFIKMAGKIRHDDVAKYYNMADCFVSASMSETQGMTFVEAMACGKAVLAMDRVALNNVLIDGKNGYYFEDVNSLAEKILMMKNRSEEQVADMKMSAKEIAEQYSSKSFGNKVMMVYEDAIENYHQIAYIKKIKMVNDEVKLTVSTEDMDIAYTVSIDDYFGLKYHKGQGLSQQDIDFLYEAHRYWHTYKSVYRKLAAGDKSEKEIRDYLRKSGAVSSIKQDEIIQKFKEMGYLSDEAVAESQIYVDQVKLLGKRKTAYHLSKRGVSKNVIEEFTGAIDENEELQRGIRKAKLYLKGIKDKSYKEALYTLRQKLMNDGYENIDEILANIEYNFDEEIEVESLEKLYQKAIRKYSNKYSGKQLSQKIYQYLLSKGYSGEMIKDVLEKMEEENDEN